MKYIIARNPAGMEMCLLFDSHIRHKDVAKSACEGMTIESAGVCVISGDLMSACGESRSLNTTSRATDGVTLTRFLFPADE